MLRSLNLDEKKLSECVKLVAINLRSMSFWNQQWLLFNIRNYKWPEWDGSVWTMPQTDFDQPRKIPSADEIEQAYKYMSEYMKHITASDQQKLLFVISNLQLKLFDNLVVCNKCGTILESTFGHDFQVCPCGSGVFVDGGREPGSSRMCHGSHGAVHFTNHQTARKYQSTLKLNK